MHNGDIDNALINSQLENIIVTNPKCFLRNHKTIFWLIRISSTVIFKGCMSFKVIMLVINQSSWYPRKVTDLVLQIFLTNIIRKRVKTDFFCMCLNPKLGR